MVPNRCACGWRERRYRFQSHNSIASNRDLYSPIQATLGLYQLARSSSFTNIRRCNSCGMRRATRTPSITKLFQLERTTRYLEDQVANASTTRRDVFLFAICRWHKVTTHTNPRRRFNLLPLGLLPRLGQSVCVVVLWPVKIEKSQQSNNNVSILNQFLTPDSHKYLLCLSTRICSTSRPAAEPHVHMMCYTVQIHSPINLHLRSKQNVNG